MVNGLKLDFMGRDRIIAELSLGLMDDIERVEVIRGPGGLVYGTGAISGVVNVVTRNIGFTHGSASITAGTPTIPLLGPSTAS